MVVRPAFVEDVSQHRHVRVQSQFPCSVFDADQLLEALSLKLGRIVPVDKYRIEMMRHQLLPQQRRGGKNLLDFIREIEAVALFAQGPQNHPALVGWSAGDAELTALQSQQSGDGGIRGKDDGSYGGRVWHERKE